MLLFYGAVAVFAEATSGSKLRISESKNVDAILPRDLSFS